MGYFSNLDIEYIDILSDWELEELDDIEEEYHISKMTYDELDQLASALYWKAQHLNNEVNRLESWSDSIRRYMYVIENKT